MNLKILIIYSILCISIFGLILKYYGMHEVLAQAIAPTTANVSITGFLGNILVNCTPVSFSQGVVVLSDGAIYPKVQSCNRPDITVDLDASTNVNWNFYINATDLMDNQLHRIPVNRIQVNTTCGGARSAVTPITLGYSLIPICAPPETATELPRNSYVNVTFFLTVPVGTYNNTYFGNFTIFANATSASNNRTWIGINQINVTISKSYDLAWTLAPIMFGTLSPGGPYNASDYLGFPSNITVGIKTNIFTDLYINGTDLIHQTIPTSIIGSGNVTYSNATGGVGNQGSNRPTDWPGTLKRLNHTLPSVSTNGDFLSSWPAGWHLIPNNTHVYNYWNITIPTGIGLEAGTYVANLTAKIVDSGANPI